MDEYVAIDALRRKGWAVVIFAPAELKGVDRQRFEERLDDYGIDLLQEMEIVGEGDD